MNGKLHKYIVLLFSIIILTIIGCRGGDNGQEQSLAFEDDDSSQENSFARGTGDTSQGNGSNEQIPDQVSQQTGSNLVVFGPQYYERTTGKPSAETAQFSVDEPDLSYVLHIYNGEADSSFKDNVSSAVVQLNGESVATPEDFSKNVSHIEKPVTLSADNIINVELRGKPGSNMTIEILGPRLIAAITDVMISRKQDFSDVPDDYTGLAYQEATGPYVPGVIGEKVQSAYIYVASISPVWTSVWVKYELFPQGTSKQVLVDYGVYKEDFCPDGWQPASGNQGYLSYDLQLDPTWPASCTNESRMLCVRYAQMNQTDSFVTNVGMSNGTTSTPDCATWGTANGGFWPMQTDGVNMIHGCDEWRYMCYGKGKPWPDMPTSIDVTDEEKLALLQSYTPRVWLDSQETFWPSSVEWAFNFLDRGMDAYERPWLITKETLDEPSSVLQFFHGCNGSATNTPCSLDEVPVYAFWTKKHNPDLSFDYVDLVYFLYYPYNRGKEVIQTIWGNHVGDWEHLSVRLTWAYDEQSRWSLKPILTYVPAHEFGSTYGWEDVPKNNDTHPVIFSAKGSHGNWLESGTHIYQVIPVLETPLFDETDEGTSWDTWNFVEAYDFDLKQGLSGNTWPIWMGDYTKDPDVCDPAIPACGPIYRWGNPESGCFELAGFCRLENGPTGPVSKNVWDDGPLR